MTVSVKNEKSWKFENRALTDLSEIAEAMGGTFDPELAKGPWDDEPDKVQWIDPETDLDCLIVRNKMGGLCGYVGLPPGHRFHGKGYDQCVLPECDEPYCTHSPGSAVQVHGGLTFADKCADGDPVEGICHVPEPGRPADVWWLGFDCGHLGDMQPYDLVSSIRHGFRYPFNDPRDKGVGRFNETYKDVEYVKAQCASLALQLAHM